jgi:hypothetical protein
MPADITTIGYPMSIGSKGAIDAAFDAWQKRRGIIQLPNWRSRMKREDTKPNPEKAPREPKVLKEPKPPKAPKAPAAIVVPRAPKMPPEEARRRMLERKKAYRAANRERILEANREYQRQRRAAMSPEERKAESIKVNEYRKKAKETK